MPRTYDETTEERASESDYGSRVQGTDRIPEDFEVDYSLVTRPVPEDLIDGSNQREQRRIDLGRDIITRISEEIGIEFDQINEVIDQLDDIDLGDATDSELLEVIAESARTITKTQSALAQTEVDKLVELVTIRESVEPNYNIVVSGTNSIDIANQPQPIVPETDDRNLPIKKLYMRSYPSNSNSIYIGDDRTAPSSGFLLRPGEWLVVDVDYRETELYMASEQSGEEMGIMGMF